MFFFVVTTKWTEASNKTEKEPEIREWYGKLSVFVFKILYLYACIN